MRRAPDTSTEARGSPSGRERAFRTERSRSRSTAVAAASTAPSVTTTP